MNVGVLNDTIGSKNFGCQLVSNSFRKLLERHKDVSNVKYFPFNKRANIDTADIDLAIVNGEGSLGHHDGNPKGFNMLKPPMEKFLAKGTPVHLVNFTLQDHNPSKYVKLLNSCASVAVRDPFSYLALKDSGVEKVQLFPDLGNTYFPAVQQDKRYDICFGFGAITKTIHKKRDQVKKYANFINELSSRYKVCFVDFPSNPVSDLNIIKPLLLNSVHKISGTFEDCYDAISKSKITITGRHHAAIMAFSAKVPFISFKANMWKTEGNQEFYGPFGHFQFNKDNVIGIADKAFNNLDALQSKANSNYNKLKPYFQGHIRTCFEDFNDPIQDGVIDPNSIRESFSKYPEVEFYKYGIKKK